MTYSGEPSLEMEGTHSRPSVQHCAPLQTIPSRVKCRLSCRNGKLKYRVTILANERAESFNTRERGKVYYETTYLLPLT